MEELIESLESTTLYDSDKEFQLLLEELKITENEWTVAELSKTRQRYTRYLRGINFNNYVNLGRKLNEFLQYTKVPQKVDKSKSYKMKTSIDFEFFLIVTAEEAVEKQM